MAPSLIERRKCAQFWNTTYVVIVRRCSKNLYVASFAATAAFQASTVIEASV